MSKTVSQLSFTGQWTLWLFLIGSSLFAISIIWWLIAWLFKLKRNRRLAGRTIIITFIATIIAIIANAFWGVN